jgi:hypothetical protein
VQTIPATKPDQPPDTGEPPATFANSTGLAGKRRRRRAAQRKAAQSKPRQAPTAPTITAQSATTPPASNTRKQKRIAANHCHGTRANRQRQQASATCTQATAKTINTTFAHQALHGNTFNPDTGEIAEYPELRKCIGKVALSTKLVVSFKA